MMKPIRIISTVVVLSGVLALLYSFTAGGTASAQKPVPFLSHKQAFFNDFSCEIHAEDSGCFDSITLPATKRLVIETVSASVTLNEGMFANFTVIYTSDDGDARFDMPLTNRGRRANPDLQVHSDAYPVRLYTEPGAQVGVFFNRGDQGRGHARAVMSGYLLECSVPPGCAIE